MIKRKQLKQHRTLLIMAPVLFITSLFLLDMGLIQFLCPMCLGGAVIDEPMSQPNFKIIPTHGSTVAPGTITVGGEITMEKPWDAAQTAWLTTFKVEFWRDGGTPKVIASKSWTASAKTTYARETASESVADGKYFIRVSMTYSGTTLGSVKTKTKYFYVEGTASGSSVVITDPVKDSTIKLTTDAKGDLFTIPVTFDIVGGSNPVKEVTVKIDSRTPKTQTGSALNGEYTFDVQIQASGAEHGVTTTHYAYATI
ncbi:MAG: hypothetical protein KAR20_02805, partial [Candidatus Heimdallarchaeota archaeon]|nr:hypothetical protein [Candidatus Heimdallarchaeota archaeon]